MPTNNQKYTIKFKVDTAELNDAFGNLERMLLNIKSIIESLPTESISGISKDLSKQISSALENVGLLTSKEKSDIGAGLKEAAQGVESAMGMLGKSKGTQQAKEELQNLLSTIQKIDSAISSLSSVQNVTNQAISSSVADVNSTLNKDIAKAEELKQRIKDIFGSISAEDFLGSIEIDQAANGDNAEKTLDTFENLKSEYISLKKELEKPIKLDNINDIEKAFNLIEKGEKYYSLTEGYSVDDLTGAIGKNIEYIEDFDERYGELVYRIKGSYGDIIKVFDNISNAQKKVASSISSQPTTQSDIQPVVGRTRNSTVTVKVKYDDNGVVDALNSTLNELTSTAQEHPVQIPAILVNDTINKTKDGIELDIKYNYQSAQNALDTEIIKPLREYAKNNKIRIPIDFDEFKAEVQKAKQELDKAKKNTKNKSASTTPVLSAKAKAELEANLNKDNETVSPSLRTPSSAKINQIAKNIHDTLQGALNKLPVSPVINGENTIKGKSLDDYLNTALGEINKTGREIPLNVVLKPPIDSIVQDFGVLIKTMTSAGDIPIKLSITPPLKDIRAEFRNLVSAFKNNNFAIDTTIDTKKIDNYLKNKSSLSQIDISIVPGALEKIKKDYDTTLNGIRKRKPIQIKFIDEGLDETKKKYDSIIGGLRGRKPVQLKIDLQINELKAAIGEVEQSIDNIIKKSSAPINLKSTNSKNITFSSRGSVSTKRNVENITESLSASEPIFRRHKKLVEEIFEAESTAVKSLSANINILNKDIESGVKSLASAMSEIKSWGGANGNIGGAINASAIESNISALTATVSNLDLSSWSDKNRKSIQEYINKVEALNNSYRLTGRFSEYKTALSSLSGPIKDLIKDETSLQEAIRVTNNAFEKINVSSYSNDVKSVYTNTVSNEIPQLIEQLTTGKITLQQFDAEAINLQKSLISMMNGEDAIAQNTKVFNQTLQSTTDKLRNFDITGYSKTMASMYEGAIRSAQQYEAIVKDGGQTIDWYINKIDALIHRLKLQQSVEDSLYKTEAARPQKEATKVNRRKEVVASNVTTQLQNIDNYVSRISNGKINLFTQRVAEATSEIRSLGQAALSICNSTESGIDDVNNAQKQFNARLRDTFSELKALANDKSYNIFNGKLFDVSGTVVGQGISDLNEAQRIMQQIVSAQDKIYSSRWTQGENGAAQWLQWSGAVKNVRGEVQQLVITYDEVSHTIRAATTEAQRNASVVGTITTQLNKAVNNFINYISVYLSAQKVISSIREGIEYVKQLDSALAELQLVTKSSDSTMQSFEHSAKDVADTVASTTTEVIKSSTEWARLGYTMQDSLELASVSAKLAKAGFMDLTSSTSQLTSSLQAFYSNDLSSGLITAGDAATEISDKFVEVGNRFAITSEGIGSSLQRSAAAMVAAGNDIDKTIALTTAGNVIAQDPNTIGNALKVISMRLRGTDAKKIADETGESVEGLDTSFAKLYGTVQKLTAVKANDFKGISILTDSGDYKDTYQILLEISEIWDQLSDANQAALLETMAGKTRGAVVAGILQNGDILKEAYEASRNAAGATEKAMVVALDTIEAKQAQLANQTQAFWQDLINSDDVKRVITFLTKVVELLDKMVNASSKFGGSLSPIFSALGGASSLIGTLRGGAESDTGLFRFKPSQFGKTLGGNAIARYNGQRYGNVMLGDTTITGKEIANLVKLNAETDRIFKNYTNRADALTAAMKNLNMAEGDFSARGTQIISDMRNRTDVLDGYTNASITAGKSILTLGDAFKKFGAIAISAIGSAAISAGISLAISAVIKGIDYVKNYSQNAVDKANANNQKYLEETKQYTQNIENLEELSERYNTLASGVDEFGHSVSLTTDEYKEYKDIVENVLEISPSVQSSYKSENELLSNKADLINKAVEAQKELNRQLLRQQTIGVNAQEWVNGLGGQLDIAQKNNGYVFSDSSAEGLSFDLGDMFYRSEEYFSGLYESTAEWVANELGDVLKDLDTTNSRVFFDENLDVIYDNLERLVYSLTPDKEWSDDFYQARSDVLSWVVDLSDYNKALEEIEQEVDEGLKRVVDAAQKADELTEFERQFAYHYAESFALDDITKTNLLDKTVYDAGAYEGIRTSIEEYTNSLTDGTIRLYEDAIKKLDESDSTIVADYENALISFLYGIQIELSNLGFELSVPDIGLQLGFFVEDANGNPTKTIQQKKELIRRALIDNGFDLDHITVGELNRMANVAIGLPVGEKMTAANMLNQSTTQIAKMRLAESKQYADATVSIDSYLSALSIVNKTLLDNVAITQEDAGIIREVIGADTDWSEAIVEVEDEISGETKYVVKNSEALKKLVSTSLDSNSVYGKLAKSQDKARKKYYDLTKELTNVIKSTKEYDDITKAHVYNLSDQIADVRRLIDSYANLEQQLLGTTNAFTEFANAQELEATNTWGDQFTGFINTFTQNIEKNEIGKPTTLAAIKAIVPGETLRGLTPDEQIQRTIDTIEQMIADGYLTVNDSQEVEIQQQNWVKFIEDGLKNGALVGTDVEHFELSDAISSLNDLAAAYGNTLSNEFLFALISKAADYNFGGTNVLSELIDSTSDQILDNIDALSLAQEKYITTLSNTASSAEDIRSAYNDVIAAQDTVDSMGQEMVNRASMIIEYERELADLDEVLSNPDIDDASLEQAARQYASISESLSDLGEFDQLQLDLALGQLDPEIADYQEKADLLASIVSDIQKQIDEAESSGEEHGYLDQQLADANAALEEVNSRLEDTERLRSEIFAKFSDDTTSVMDELESISKYEIDNKRFEVICNGNNATKTLDDILQKLNRLRNARIKIDGAVSNDAQEGGSQATGTFGRSYANGKANDLVGELGREMVVDPATGRYYTVGDNGPEMINLPANAIVFNARQTEDLLSSGHTSTRGKALAEGNASKKKLMSDYRALVDKRTEAGPNYVGNVDINNRPIVLNSDGSYSTTSTSFQEGWYGDEATGGYRIAHYTPILPDGTWLSDEDVGEYIYNILQQQDPMSADANGYGIVYKIDTDIDGQKITDPNLQAAFEMADAWDVAMHELQNAIYKDEAELKARIYGSPTQRMFGDSYANGKANDLVGELGRELVVDPSTGRYYTVGDNGPEMVDLPANAIVFNAKQTDDLLSQGYTSTRGKALVTGNAYDTYTGGGGNSNIAYTERNGTPTHSYHISYRNGNSSSSSSSASAEAQDWYEAFEKAYNDLKKLRDDDVIDADEYYRRLQALYTDYHNKYGTASEENADKLRDAWKQMYEDEKSDLEDRYNNNEMGTREYLDRLRNLYQRFYKDIPGFAKEAARAQKEYLNVLKGEYDKLFSSAVSIIGNRISALQDEYSERVEALEKEQEAADKEFQRQIKEIDKQIKGYEKQIKAVQKQIKVYEKEIDTIQKANEARQDAIDLQKAQYELARAQYQRTQHVYTSEKGFVYRANPQDIKSAQENLETKEQEARVKSIQKEIDALQEVVDGYNEKIDLLNEEKERIQELQEATDEYYENAIQAVRDYYEPLIKNLEKTQQMWQDFIDAEELAENIGVFKEFGITVDQVLNSTAGDIDIVKGKYAELLAAYYADNPEMLSAWSDVMGTDLANVVTNIDSLGTSLDGFGTHLAGMTQPWGEVMHTLGSVPEELTTVVNQSVNAITASQEPIDHYIQYILQFEDAMREAGVTIGDFWQANGELKAGIDQGAFEMYVTSWNKLNEELSKAPGNIEPTSAALKAIMDSSITREQVDNYSQWLNEMSAHMPGISQSVAAFAGNDISGVTGNMAAILSASNVKNAAGLGESLPNVSSSIGEMSNANLTGALSLSSILSTTNADNASALSDSLSGMADGISDMSGTDLGGVSGQMTTLAGNATGMSELATAVGDVSTAFSSLNGEEALNSFQNFATEFERIANEFKATVQSIFNGEGGGDGGDTGQNQNTGKEGSANGENGGGGGNAWYQGFIDSTKDMVETVAGESMEDTEALLPKLLDAFIQFRDGLTEIIGTAEDEGETILGTLRKAGLDLGAIFGIGENEVTPETWIGAFTELLGEEGENGLTTLCSKIQTLVENMCTAITTACDEASKAISGVVEAANGIAGVDGTATTKDFSVLHGRTYIQYWNGERAYTGDGGADGTAHANGTALANGRWGLKRDQRGTIVGELGPETLIRNGQYSIIGAAGPERLNLKKNDIILNHRQTEQIFKYGRATGRGKAYASGTVSQDIPGLVHTTMPTGFDKFVSIIKDIGVDIKVMKPKLHHIELAVAGAGAGVGGFGSTTTNTIENINVSLPNFNSSKADDLINDLQSLSLQAIQRFNRK